LNYKYKKIYLVLVVKLFKFD